MRLCRNALLLSISAAIGFAQLTTEQKLADFEATAGIFAKQYAPLEWKKKVEKVDILDTAPWAAKVRATKNDLEFFEVMTAYVNSLNDAHSGYYMRSSFVANLNFVVDVYDGKLLVDSVNRTRLPASSYPIAVGYELVSIDGQDATKLLDFYSKYDVAANARSTRRNAAQFITIRPQQVIPSAPSVPEISTVIFRRFDGNLETYRIPWSRSGLAWAGNGQLPVARTVAGTSRRAAIRTATGSVNGADQPESPVQNDPKWRTLFASLWNSTLPQQRAVVNFGATSPYYGLPGTFVQRLGRLSTDAFFSGTYRAQDLRIGFIRIPSFQPPDPLFAVSQFVREMAYMQQNTDGMVVDITRNTGGDVGYTHQLLALLHHYPFRGMTFQVRATSTWIEQFSYDLEFAKTLGAPQDYLDLGQKILDALIEANRSNRGLTEAIPLDDVRIVRDPARDAKGNLLAYSLPLIVLVDDFSASAAELFAGVIQDSGRGPLFGFRTMGAGGNIAELEAGSYSEGFVSVTQSLMVRASERAEDGGYPASPYIENVGVRPDIDYDYMTRDNLAQFGKPFVDAFTAAIVDQIRKNQ